MGTEPATGRSAGASPRFRLETVEPTGSPADREWLRDLWRRRWGGEAMVSAGRLHRIDDLPAVVAWSAGERVGAAACAVDGRDCELVSLDALVECQGVGSALLQAVEASARSAACLRIWLITTNDNVDALGFYQRRGYRLVALRPGAVDAARRLKPAIPLVGSRGIPIHDEIELAKRLDAAG